MADSGNGFRIFERQVVDESRLSALNRALAEYEQQRVHKEPYADGKIHMGRVVLARLAAEGELFVRGTGRLSGRDYAEVERLMVQAGQGTNLGKARDTLRNGVKVHADSQRRVKLEKGQFGIALLYASGGEDWPAINERANAIAADAKAQLGEVAVAELEPIEAPPLHAPVRTTARPARMVRRQLRLDEESVPVADPAAVLAESVNHSGAA